MLASNENMILLHTIVLLRSSGGKTSFLEGFHTGKGKQA